jgi:hypothetical protein
VAGSRADWPIRRYRLGDEPSDDVSDLTTPEQRLRSMWRLAQEGWRLAGRELPVYDRVSMPTRLYRPGEPRPE